MTTLRWEFLIAKISREVNIFHSRDILVVRKQVAKRKLTNVKVVLAEYQNGKGTVRCVSSTVAFLAKNK